MPLSPIQHLSLSSALQSSKFHRHRRERFVSLSGQIQHHVTMFDFYFRASSSPSITFHVGDMVTVLLRQVSSPASNHAETASINLKRETKQKLFIN